MPVINIALPTVLPATVISAARVPRVAPVEITSVTIGPGTMTSTKVMSRKTEKRLRFISLVIPGRGRQAASPESILRSAGVWIPGSVAALAPRNDGD